MKRVVAAATGLWMVACLGAPGAAADSVVQIAGASIVLPDPPGLTELRNKVSPYYRFTLAAQGKNADHLLANYLPPADADNADGGGAPSPGEWASAFTLGGAGGRAVTEDEFLKEFLPAVESSIREPDPLEDPDSQKGIEQLGKDLNAPPGRLRLVQTRPTGIYVRKPGYFAYASASQVRAERADGTVNEVRIVDITGFMLVKQRLFSFGLYRQYREPLDIERAKTDAAMWAESITRANR
jgi:hypothetical protein